MWSVIIFYDIIFCEFVIEWVLVCVLVKFILMKCGMFIFIKNINRNEIFVEILCLIGVFIFLCFMIIFSIKVGNNILMWIFFFLL